MASSGAFIINFEHISQLFLQFLLFILNKYLPAGMFNYLVMFKIK